VPPEVAGGERDGRRRPAVVRVRGENRGARGARLAHRRGRAVVHRDEAVQPDRNGVTGAVRVRVVVGELEASHEQESVGRERAGALTLDRREVGADVRGVDARAPVPERSRIVAAQDVVGDAENIEAGRSVKVDHRSERKLAVAPGRVGVELGEQGACASSHAPPVCPRPAADRVNAR
jgi:hypothetical protein